MGNTNGTFPTMNTALAAYLKTEGFTHVDTTANPKLRNPKDFDAVFHFQNDPHILDCVHLWNTGQAEGNHSVFLDNYRQLVGEAKKVVSVARL